MYNTWLALAAERNSNAMHGRGHVTTCQLHGVRTNNNRARERERESERVKHLDAGDDGGWSIVTVLSRRAVN